MAGPAEMGALEEEAAAVAPAVPAAEAGMALLAAAYLMAKPQTEDKAVLPAMVAREVMAAQAETVALAVTVVLSILRSRQTSTEASVHLPAAVSVAVVGKAEKLAKLDLLARQVEAVTALKARAVHSAQVAPKGQLGGPEIQATPVAVGIPDRPAVTEPMAL